MPLKTVGVLALQGAFKKHCEILEKIGVRALPIRHLSDLEKCEALIIPGGESTVITRGIDFIGMKDALWEFSKSKPIFGTCAGLILMAVSCQDPRVSCLGLLDVEVQRNGFGRQVESFSSLVSLKLKGKERDFRALFIRAPRIQKIGKSVKVLALYNDEPVLIQQGIHLGAVFHPELTGDPIIHRYFLEHTN